MWEPSTSSAGSTSLHILNFPHLRCWWFRFQGHHLQYHFQRCCHFDVSLFHASMYLKVHQIIGSSTEILALLPPEKALSAALSCTYREIIINLICSKKKVQSPHTPEDRKPSMKDSLPFTDGHTILWYCAAGEATVGDRCRLKTSYKYD